MSLTLYYAPFSSATTVQWALEELGVPHEKVKLDLSKGDTKKPDFLKLNPNGKVPLIVHDGTPIFESVAILIYLGETFGVEKGLFPAAGPKRGEAIQWLVWSNVSLGGALALYLNASNERIAKEEHNAAAAARGKKETEKHLDILEAHLEGRKFVVGDSFTLVDMHVGGFAWYLGMCGFDMKRWPRIEALSKSSQSRPAFAKVASPG